MSKIKLPRSFEATDNINYTKYFLHFNKQKDCDYAFYMAGTVVDKFVNFGDKNVFVLPNFKKELAYGIPSKCLQGQFVFQDKCFSNLQNCTLIVTGDGSILFNPKSFDEGAKVNLILPKDMNLFLVQYKHHTETKKNVSHTWALVAKQNLSCQKPNDVGVWLKKVEKIEQSSDIPFSISTDLQHFYDRVTHALEQNSQTKTKQDIEKR